MDILEFKDLEDWRLKNECYPFEDSLGNLCISVESEYESFGGEKDARLLEAKYYGIDRLIRFYGKLYIPDSTTANIVGLPTPTELYDAASTPDYFISSRVCVRMKVLVKIPKSTFDENTADDATCDINKPAEGYLSAFISVENYERDIDYITTSMEDFLPKMVKADKYITNINIVKEIKRLKQVKSVIGRYFNLNSVTATAIKEEECEADKQSQMEIGFDYDYKPAFALIDGNQHTIGYDCFLEASLLSHPTTANYLTQLGSMSSALTDQLSLNFDIFKFLSQHTYPTPVIEAKKNSLDGLEKYDGNGNLFSFANLAKLITLDIDRSCKTDEQTGSENRVLWNEQTSRSIADAARQSKDFVGNWKTSTEGVQELKETWGSMKETASSEEGILGKVYDDVIAKIDFGCVIEESLKCMLEEAITRIGEEAFDDPDLSEFFNADGVAELFGLCGEEEDCDKELKLKVGLPVFQGINIPDNFPTTDYLAKALDEALKKLYGILIDAIVSFIMTIFELMCKMISSIPDGAAIKSMFGDGFKSWLSKTIGVDASLLTDGKAWADAVLSAGGTGFMGEIGNLSAKVAGSWDALVQDTGISLNLPNPNTGMVEEVLISPDLIYQTMSGVQKATEDLEVILTSGELKSLYKGAAPDDVLDLAFGCLHRGNPDLFQSREDVSDLFSSLGKMVKGNLLETPATYIPTVTNACDLPDGSNQNTIAKNFLTSKDPLLSDSEVEELLSREKNRFIEKIKKIHKLLKSFQDGSIFPTFPSLFGSDDSLIPEVPPVISDAMKSAAAGMYASSMNSLNAIMIQYPDIWDTVFQNESINMNALYDNNITGFSVTEGGDVIVMGYDLSVELQEIPPETYPIDIDTEFIEYESSKGSSIDLGSFTSESTNFATDSLQIDPFKDLLDSFGLEKLDYKDRAAIIDEINKIDEELRDLLQGRWAETWSDIKDFFTAKWADKLEWEDLNLFRVDVRNTLKKEVDNILSQLAVTLEEWMSYDEECRELIWNSVGKIFDLDGDRINDTDDVKDFTKVVEAYNSVDIIYMQGKKALVVMDIANFLEDEDDAPDGVFYPFPESDYDENGLWDENADREISPKPEYNQEWFNESGSEKKKITLTYNITDVMSDSAKGDYASEAGDVDPDKFEFFALITEKVKYNLDTGESPYKYQSKKWFVKTGIELIEKDEQQDGTTPIREDDWTETLTTLERKGLRPKSTSQNSNDGSNINRDISAITLQSVFLTDGNDKYDVISANKIKTSIGNYKIGNEALLSLGRKESKSDLLDEKYSFTTDNIGESTSESLKKYEEGSTLSVTSARYEEMVEDTGSPVESDEYAEKLESLINSMRERLVGNDLRLVDNVREVTEDYLKSDAIKYKDLTKWASEHIIDVMKIQQLDEMCDNLTSSRRTAASMGIRMLAREFILECALISLQVFDSFNTGFMESEAFRKTVFNNIRTEMKKYKNSFDDTLSGSIFSDIKDASVKYYEYRSLLGEEVETMDGLQAFLSIIGEEIGEIRDSIVKSLDLSENGTWDDFVLDELIPAADFLVENDYNADEEYFYLRIHKNITGVRMCDFGIPCPPLFSSECGGTSEEGEIIVGSPNVCGDVKNTILSGKYLTVRQMLFDNEEYKEFINHIFPFRELITQLSVYQASALSDVAVFSGTYEGRNLFDIFAETKLSTIQTFLASIHGAGEITYIDPFLEKLKT